jgi:hypothetical protein
MGAWGYGNLENDGAQDLLASISKELFGRVMELLKHPRGHEYDDMEFDELGVRMEMIFALHERGMINTSPAPEDLKALCQPFLQRWADYWRHAAHVEPGPEWRKVLEDSFTRLIEIAGRECGGSFEHRCNLIMDKMGKSGDNPTPPP